jgi:hypothetical protein
MANLTQENQGFTATGMLAGKPTNPEIEIGIGPVKVKADITIWDSLIRAINGVGSKSEFYHNMTDDGRASVNAANNLLKSAISINSNAGAASSFKELARIYKEQANIQTDPALKQEGLRFASEYTRFADLAKKGNLNLNQFKQKVDVIGQNTTEGSPQQLATNESSLLAEYRKIVAAYTDENGKVDSSKLSKDLAANNASQETKEGVLALVTPENQKQGNASTVQRELG